MCRFLVPINKLKDPTFTSGQWGSANQDSWQAPAWRLHSDMNFNEHRKWNVSKQDAFVCLYGEKPEFGSRAHVWHTEGPEFKSPTSSAKYYVQGLSLKHQDSSTGQIGEHLGPSAIEILWKGLGPHQWRHRAEGLANARVTFPTSPTLWKVTDSTGFNLSIFLLLDL